MTTIEELRDEIRSELDDLRRELRDQRRLIEERVAPGARRPSTSQLLEGLDEMEQLRAAILRRRHGELLPPQAEEIARMRDERAAEVLGDRAA